MMTSTVRAEYVWLSHGAKECMTYSELVDFFRDAVKGKVPYGLEGASKFTIKEESDMANGNEFEKHASPLMCFVDNEGSIRITKKREMTKLAKHITIKHHHIRSLYEQRCIDTAYVNAKDQIVDVLTRGLLSADHLKKVQEVHGSTRKNITEAGYTSCRPSGYSSAYKRKQLWVQPMEFVSSLRGKCFI